MTTETKVEAVAWMCRFQDTKQIWIDEVCVWKTEAEATQCAADMNEEIEGANFEAVKLCDASALDALRGEVAEQSAWADKWKALHDAVSLAHEVQAKSLTRALDRADAAERRVAELEAGAQAVVLAFEALGESKGIVSDRSAHRQCEATLVTLKSLLTKETP